MLIPACPADWATASAAAAGAAGDAPIGARGGGTANAATKALSAAEYGVWAGVKLPGGQYRKREQLARAHDVLRRIAAGEVNPRQLPENAALLARSEGASVAVTAVVLHLPARIGPRSAA